MQMVFFFVTLIIYRYHRMIDIIPIPVLIRDTNVNQITLRVGVHDMLPLFTLPLYGTASIRNAIYNAQNSKGWINPGKKLCLFPVYLHHIASNRKHETISPCFLTEKVISLL